MLEDDRHCKRNNKQTSQKLFVIKDKNTKEIKLGEEIEPGRVADC